MNEATFNETIRAAAAEALVTGEPVGVEIQLPADRKEPWIGSPIGKLVFYGGIAAIVVSSVVAIIS